MEGCSTEKVQNEANTSEENANDERWNCDRLFERSDAAARRATHQRSVRRRNVTRLRSAKKADMRQ